MVPDTFGTRVHSMLPRSPELREHRRYCLAATVTFSWETPDGAAGTGEGQTRDISAASVFVLTSCLLPVESLVQLEVILPPLSSRHRVLQLRAKGRVVRTEHEGFAAIGDMGFRIELVEAHGGDGVDLLHKKDSGETFDARTAVLN